MKLLAARCGTINVDSGLLDGGGLSGTLRAVPSMCFVIDHPEGVIVWDTSMHPAVCTDAVGYWGPLAKNVTVPEYEPDDTLTARLELISTIGHTPGHQSLAVTFPSGRRFVLSGDAVYNREQLETGQPPGLTWDREAATQSVGVLGALVEKGATVLISHDPRLWVDVATVAPVWDEDDTS